MKRSWKKFILGHNQICWLNGLMNSPAWQNHLSWKEKMIIRKVLDQGWYNNKNDELRLKMIF